MRDHSLPLERGRALEALVADVFAGRGYRVARNVAVTGASGTRYEVDVLAEPADALVAGRVAVECKNLATPVDAQVVARLRMLCDDVRIGEGVIAAPGGYTPAAQASAAQAGITLWGRDEITRHAGEAAVEALSREPVSATAPGVARTVTAERAARAVRTRIRGAWGVGRAADGPWAAWVPVHELEVHHTLPGRRGGLHANVVWAGYEGITGTPLGIADAPWPTEDVALDAPVLPSMVTDGQLADTLAVAALRRDQVVQEAARARHRATLEDHGLDPDAGDIHVPTRRTLYVPVWMAVTHRRDGARAVIIDAATGRPDAALEQAFTARLGPIVNHVTGAASTIP